MPFFWNFPVQCFISQHLKWVWNESSSPLISKYPEIWAVSPHYKSWKFLWLKSNLRASPKIGLARVFIRHTVEEQAKSLFLKTCLWIRNVVLVISCSTPWPILCGSQESPFLGYWANKDWREAEAQNCSLLSFPNLVKATMGLLPGGGLRPPQAMLELAPIRKWGFSWWGFRDSLQYSLLRSLTDSN